MHQLRFCQLSTALKYYIFRSVIIFSQCDTKYSQSILLFLGLFVIIFASYVLGFHKLHGEPTEDDASLVALVASTSLPTHKSLDEDVNEYLSFRSVAAPSYLNPNGGLATFLSFKTRH